MIQDNVSGPIKVKQRITDNYGFQKGFMTDKLRIATIIFSLLVLWAASSAMAAERIEIDPTYAIRADFQAGIISADEMALLQLTAITNSSDLPARYQPVALSTSMTHIRCGTMALLDIKRNWSSLSTSTQLTVSEALSRPSMPYTFDSPGGYFKLHYTDTGVDAVPAEDIDIDGIPDYIERSAAYLDTAYTMNTSLGYMDPPDDNGVGGDDRYDVYFKEIYDVYGYTVPDEPGPMPWNDYYSYIVMHNTFIGFPPNDDPEGDQAGAAKVTAAHEFHHAVQFGYDAGEELWIMESDAVYMEDIVYDLVNDNYNYLWMFMTSPQTSLMENTSHFYSCFIWEMYLAERFDTSLMVAMWEGAIAQTVFHALEDTLMDRYGWTIDSVFAEFTTYNYCTSTRADDEHYAEAATYPAMTINRHHNSYPVPLSAPTVSPAGYGSVYVQFHPNGAAGDLNINFNGADTRQWAAYVIKSTLINEHVIEKLELDPVTYIGSVQIPDFQDYYQVTLVGANISEHEGSASFSYSADVTIPYSLSGEVLTQDSSVYSGGERGFEVNVVNTSPVVDIISVISWDNQGWVPLDTISKSVNPDENMIYTVAVRPPQATTLESTATLSFKVQSWGDPEVSEFYTAGAKAVLQRGDLDFSGFLDISDLTYFVEFMFNEGTSPQPIIESGDFDCVTDVNISDLTALVEFLFQSGPASPCNPY